MNQENFQKIFDETIIEAKGILFSKGKEYASNVDRLANFKDIGAALGITADKICWAYLAKHLRALEFEIREGKPSIESASRIQDCINYLIFLQAIKFELDFNEEAYQKVQSGIGSPSMVYILQENDAKIRINDHVSGMQQNKMNAEPSYVSQYQLDKQILERLENEKMQAKLNKITKLRSNLVTSSENELSKSIPSQSNEAIRAEVAA